MSGLLGARHHMIPIKRASERTWHSTGSLCMVSLMLAFAISSRVILCFCKTAHPICCALVLPGGVPGGDKEQVVALARRALPQVVIDEHHAARVLAKVLAQWLDGVVLLPARRDALLPCQSSLQCRSLLPENPLSAA